MMITSKCRNFLIAIALTITSFFIASNVYAATYSKTFVYDYENSNLDLLRDNLDIVNTVIDYANEYNVRDYTYVIQFSKTGGSYYLVVGLGEFTSDNVFFDINNGGSSARNYIYYHLSFLNGENDTIPGAVPINYQVICTNGSEHCARHNHIDLNLSTLTEESKETFLNNVKNAFENGFDGFMNMYKTYYSISSLSMPNMFNLSNFNALVYSNRDITFTRKYNLSEDITDNLYLDGHYYNYGDNFPTYYNYFNLGPNAIPKVDLNYEYTLFDKNNDPLQAKITVDWGFKDFDRFKYMWAKDDEVGNWKYFFMEDPTDEIIVNLNGGYIFQVTDLEDNYVTSATMNIVDLAETLPKLKFEDATGPDCFFNNQKICRILTLYSENIDFSKYTIQYKINDGEWIKHNYNNSVKGEIQINENMNIIGRIIRNSDNAFIDAISWTIEDINTDIIIDEPIFKFDKTFCTNLSPNEGHDWGHGNYKETLKMTIYGLDLTQQRVSYSIDDAKTFIDITNDLVGRTNFVKSYSFEYYEDISIIIQVTDLEGNYITAVSYYLFFSCNDINGEHPSEIQINDTNDVFRIVKNFFTKTKNIMTKFKEVIEYFYNSMNDEIKAFILTIFILIIVCNLIMRMMK